MQQDSIDLIHVHPNITIRIQRPLDSPEASKTLNSIEAHNLRLLSYIDLILIANEDRKAAYTLIKEFNEFLLLGINPDPILRDYFYKSFSKMLVKEAPDKALNISTKKGKGRPKADFNHGKEWDKLIKLTKSKDEHRANLFGNRKKKGKKRSQEKIIEDELYFISTLLDEEASDEGYSELDLQRARNLYGGKVNGKEIGTIKNAISKYNQVKKKAKIQYEKLYQKYAQLES